MSNELLKKFGSRVRKFRLLREMSQEVLAARADIDRSYISDVERGLRNISLKNIFVLAHALNIPAHFFLLEDENILERLEITLQDLEQLIDANPSLRGFIIGYLAESKLTKFFAFDRRITALNKFDDHDRANKHDLVITYKGNDYTLEVKSLQTNTVRLCEGKWFENAELEAKFQCDASDRRTITLPDGDSVTTTCLRFGDFDILAVNLYAFGKGWKFGFALNRDLPHSTYRKYPAEAQKQLIKSLIPISHPLQTPFVEDPFILLEQLHLER